MKVSALITHLLRAINYFFRRFHVMIFTIIALGGLIVAMYTINTSIAKVSSDNGYEPKTLNTKFDDKTVEEIKELRSSTEGQEQVSLPAGRTNPFSD